MESITIERTKSGYWWKRFDNYDKHGNIVKDIFKLKYNENFCRISEAKALENIIDARSRGDMFSDDNENIIGFLVRDYYN